MAVSAELSRDIQLAAPIVGSVWAAIRSVDGPYQDGADYHLFRVLLHPEMLGAMPLPTGKNRPAGQTVALADKAGFERPTTQGELTVAYNERPRTRIYESISGRSGRWPAAATRAFMRLSGCQVTCTAYESSVGDLTMGRHRDRWYGAVVQVLGEKAWFFGQDADETLAKPTAVTQAGDVLLVSPGRVHDVKTPNYSLHLGFAFLTHKPIG